MCCMIQVPGGEVDRAITRCPQLVGSSATRTMQPVVHCLNTLGVKSKRLGRVIARSPQLLLHTPRELNEVIFV
jgi:mTERF domain-containing protein